MNKANFKIIKKIAEEKGITLKWLADRVGISQQGLSFILKENTTKVDTLIKIANELQVPISSFFEMDFEGGSLNNGIIGGDLMVNSKKEADMTIKALIEQLKVKDQQIDKLLKTINKQQLS